MDNKKLKYELNQVRNKLYQDLPTGETNAFDLIIVIKKHIKELDILIDKIQ